MLNSVLSPPMSIQNHKPNLRASDSLIVQEHPASGRVFCVYEHLFEL